jgi:TRAP-type C4-dicarboxylate transport system permease small subunit
MTDDESSLKANRFFGQLIFVTTLIGAFFMAVVVLMTIADVFMRSFFNHPLKGALELCQLFTVPLIWFGVAYTMRVGGHVRMEMLSEALFKGRRGIYYWIIVRLTLLVIMVLMSIAAFDGAAYSISGAELTDILDIPVYPFKIVLVAGSIMFVLEICAEILNDINSLLRSSQPKEG